MGTHRFRLGRDAAIKELPPHLNASVEVRARLKREARTMFQSPSLGQNRGRPMSRATEEAVEPFMMPNQIESNSFKFALLAKS
jgi:hypothetical protein